MTDARAHHKSASKRAYSKRQMALADFHAEMATYYSTRGDVAQQARKRAFDALDRAAELGHFPS